MKNNKGFTLIELIATILILGIVATIAGVSITGIMKSANEKNYELLIKDIVHASELYYQECTYMANISSDVTVSSGCVTPTNGKYSITIEKLVEYGYLNSNNTEGNVSNKSIINPKNNDDITDCNILISYSNGSVIVEPSGTNDKCPGEYK